MDYGGKFLRKMVVFADLCCVLSDQVIFLCEQGIVSSVKESFQPGVTASFED